jgi:hypothetical protein
MKNKLIALLATIGLVSSASAIEINENLSINGFIDGSYNDTERSLTVAGVEAKAEDSQLGIDEVEIDFIFNTGNISAEAHIDNYDTDGNEDLSIEQAFIKYTTDSGLGFTFGRKGLNSGFEREDPNGLYTYSRAYDFLEPDGLNNSLGIWEDPTSDGNLGNVDVNAFEGIQVDYSSDAFTAGVFFFQSFDADLDDRDLFTEIYVSYTGIDNLRLFAGYIMTDDVDLRIDGGDGVNDGVDDVTFSLDVDYINLYAEYTIDKLMVAAEYLNADLQALGDTDLVSLWATYQINEQIGATARFSTVEDLAEKITIAGSYKISDNLGAILEYSDVSDDLGVAGIDYDADQVALELTYTF